MADTPNLDQQRARHAWMLIEQVRGEKDDVKKEFKIQAKRLPARIMASGLGQALAFLEAKHSAPLLRAALADWINHHDLGGGKRSGQPRLLLRVVQEDGDFLRFATAECLAYLQWVVRFTDAEFRDLPDAEEN